MFNLGKDSFFYENIKKWDSSFITLTGLLKVLRIQGKQFKENQLNSYKRMIAEMELRIQQIKKQLGDQTVNSSNLREMSILTEMDKIYDLSSLDNINDQRAICDELVAEKISLYNKANEKLKVLIASFGFKENEVLLKTLDDKGYVWYELKKDALSYSANLKRMEKELINGNLLVVLCIKEIESLVDKIPTDLIYKKECLINKQIENNNVDTSITTSFISNELDKQNACTIQDSNSMHLNSVPVVKQENECSINFIQDEQDDFIIDPTVSEKEAYWMEYSALEITDDLTTNKVISFLGIINWKKHNLI